MAYLVPNTFSSFAFNNEEEQIGAGILSAPNIQHIQNQIADLAQQRINADFDPEKPLLFMQREAELKGQIQILQWLIDNSNESAKILAIAQEADRYSPS